MTGTMPEGFASVNELILWLEDRTHGVIIERTAGHKVACPNAAAKNLSLQDAEAYLTKMRRWTDG